MANNNEKGGGKGSDASIEARRRLLRTVTAGGTALGVAALPGKWAKPIVSSVILPAHGQTSPGTTCCPGGLTGDSSVGSTGTYTFTATNYPFATYNGTYLEGGTHSTLKYSNLGPCPPSCDGSAIKYAGKYETFDGNGGYQFSYVVGIRCSGEPLLRKYFEYNFTRAGSLGPGTFKYTGALTTGYEICKYLTENNRALSGAVEGVQRRSRGRRFKFGG